VRHAAAVSARWIDGDAILAGAVTVFALLLLAASLIFGN
jgi:hypothetical protein